MKTSVKIVCMVSLPAYHALNAQDYPTHSIRIVLPFLPGGGTDILACVLAQRFQESMGQNVVVDNRAGAGGNISAEIVTKSTLADVMKFCPMK